MTTPDQPTRPGPAARRTPTPLALATGLVLVEAVVLAGFGIAEVFWLSSSRLTMGVTTALFFVAYGVGLGWCAWKLRQLESWARAPIVLAQLIQLPVAWGFRGGSTTAVAVVLIVAALAVLAGVFHPASLRAVEAADRRDRDGSA